MPDHVEVCAIQLPGRGSRTLERPFAAMNDLIAALGPEITGMVDRPFVFFGHSLGALISFEMTRWLRSSHLPLPAHLIVSGRRAPHLPDMDPPFHAMSDADLLANVANLNGTPPEIIADPELMELILPALRADFRVAETYEFIPAAALTCPITAFGGMLDGETVGNRLDAWRDHTTGAFLQHRLDGGHFFLATNASEFLELLRHALLAFRR